MAIEISFAKLALADSEGALVWRDGALVAVLSKLSPEHRECEGMWHTEIILTSNGYGGHPVFPDIKTAIDHFEAPTSHRE